MFGWLRNRVKVAVLAGVEDALVELECGPAADAHDDFPPRPGDFCNFAAIVAHATPMPAKRHRDRFASNILKSNDLQRECSANAVRHGCAGIRFES